MPSRQSREREFHRQFILERAVKEFAENGYQATTMNQIAEAAEVCKGTLYNYFSSKDEIFLSLIEYGMSHLLEIIDQALGEERSVEEKVRILVRRFVEFFEEGHDFQKILMLDGERIMMAAHKELSQMMREHIGHLTLRLVDFIRQGQEEGIFRKADPELAAVILLNIITANMKHTLITGVKRTDASDVEDVTQFALGALCSQGTQTDPAL